MTRLVEQQSKKSDVTVQIVRKLEVLHQSKFCLTASWPALQMASYKISKVPGRSKY